jgi:hypothetical protein
MFRYLRFNPCLSSLFSSSWPERFFCVAIMRFAALVVDQTARLRPTSPHLREEVVRNAAVGLFVNM